MTQVSVDVWFAIQPDPFGENPRSPFLQLDVWGVDSLEFQRKDYFYCTTEVKERSFSGLKTLENGLGLRRLIPVIRLHQVRSVNTPPSTLQRSRSVSCAKPHGVTTRTLLFTARTWSGRRLGGQDAEGVRSAWVGFLVSKAVFWPSKTIQHMVDLVL